MFPRDEKKESESLDMVVFITPGLGFIVTM
jgi:hypothetical protein